MTRTAIVVRVVAENAQLEATLAMLGRVAGAHVAAVLAEDRPDLFLETDSRSVDDIADLDRDIANGSPDGHGDTGRTVAPGQQLSRVVDGDDRGGQRGISCGPAEVLGSVRALASVSLRMDDKLNTREVTTQRGAGGHDLERSPGQHGSDQQARQATGQPSCDGHVAHLRSGAEVGSGREG